MEYYSTVRRTKLCHFQENGWYWQSSHYMKQAALGNISVTCSPQYMKYKGDNMKLGEYL